MIILSRSASAQDYFFEFVDGWVNNGCYEYNDQYHFLGLEIIGTSTEHQYLYNSLSENGNLLNQISHFQDSTSSTTVKPVWQAFDWLSDSELLIAGIYTYPDTNSQSASLVKYNINTNEFTEIGEFSPHQQNQFWQCKVLEDGHVLTSGVQSDGVQSAILTLYLINNSGQIVWEYLSSCGTNCLTHPKQILSASENNIYILAEEYDDNFPTFFERLSTTLIKTNDLGEEQWRVYPGDHANFWIDPGGIIEEENGIRVFYTNPRYYDTDGEWHFNFDNSIYSEKYDFDGNLIEEYTLYEDIPHNVDFPQYAYEVFQAQKLNNGDYLISGTDGYDGLLLKISPSGELIWRRAHALYDENNNDDAIVQYTRFHNVTPTSDGGFMAAGQYYSDPSTVFPNGIQTAIALKVDEFGCLEPGCHLIDNIEEPEVLKGSLSIFPNPVQDELFIELTNTFQNALGNLKVYNNLGEQQEIQQNVIQQNVIQLDISKLSAGIYIVEWIAEDKVYTGTFIRQ